MWPNISDLKNKFRFEEKFIKAYDKIDLLKDDDFDAALKKEVKTVTQHSTLKLLVSACKKADSTSQIEQHKYWYPSHDVRFRLDFFFITTYLSEVSSQNYKE